MKKFIWLFVLLIGISFSFANWIDFDSSILKVNVYRYMEWTKFTRLEQYGSAIYIGNWKIITNSHVILDSKTKEVLNNIEICGSISSWSNIKCWIPAKILYYDPDIDLAMLEMNPNWNIPTTKFADNDPKTADKIMIKWFPWDGFSTITQTEGVVWWVYNDYYKIDASINWWNSWWGGFDKSFSLIWIPTFKAGEWSNIWYIIPVSAVKKFSNWEWNIIKNESDGNPWFSSYIKLLDNIKFKKTIWNSLFSFDIPEWFKLNEVDLSNWLFNYEIKDKKNWVAVTMWNIQFIGSFDLDKHINNEYEINKDDDTKIITWEISSWSTKRKFIEITLEWLIWRDYYTIMGNNVFSIKIMAENKNNNNFKEAMTWYKKINIKTNWLPSKNPSFILRNNLLLPISNKLLFTKYIDYDEDGFGKDVILDIEVPNVKKNTATENNWYYENNLVVSKLWESELSEKDPEEVLGINNYNVDVNTIKWLVETSSWSIFYVEKNKNSEGDFVVVVKWFMAIWEDKYSFSINYNIWKDDSLLQDILDNINKIQIVWDTSFIERSDDPVSINDLFGGQKAINLKKIDISKVTFKDYTDYKKRKLTWHERVKLNETNKYGKSYIKLIDTQSSYRPWSDLEIKWYAENIEKAIITIISENWIMFQEEISLDKDNPSWKLIVDVPKALEWDILLWIIGITKNYLTLSDYSDSLLKKN